MKLGIDIDDTITDSFDFALQKAVDYCNLDYDEVSNKNLNWDNLYFGGNGFPPLENYILSSYNEWIPKFKLKKDVRDIIKRLINEGHEIIFITARSHAFPGENVKYLKDNDIPFTKVYEAAGNKVEVALKENIDVLIDDSVNNCSAVSEAGIPVLLYDNCYNRNCNKFNRVTSWKQIYNVINEMSKK